MSSVIEGHLQMYISLSNHIFRGVDRAKYFSRIDDAAAERAYMRIHVNGRVDVGRVNPTGSPPRPKEREEIVTPRGLVAPVSPA
jgi:hypothetical protein